MKVVAARLYFKVLPNNPHRNNLLLRASYADSDKTLLDLEKWIAESYKRGYFAGDVDAITRMDGYIDWYGAPHFQYPVDNIVQTSILIVDVGEL